MLYHEKRAHRAGYLRVAGLDEAGRGPLAGPVVAASVILKKGAFKNRIDDSKVLTAKQRERAYREIVKKTYYGVGIVDEKTIDRINIYKATVLAMEQALKKLDENPDFLLIDGRVKLSTRHKRVYISGGDSKSLSIACASIIAKVTRDRIMQDYHNIYPQYGFRKHKGYGTKDHFRAIAKHGPSPIHRLTFRPLKQT